MRKLLAQTQARATQSTGGKQPPDLVNGKGSDGEKLRALERSIVAAEGEGEGSGKGGKEEVVLKATSRAIERALELGLFFQEQEDLVVRLRTGTVGAVDDVVVEEEEEEGEGKSKGKKRGRKRKGKGSGGKVAGGAGDEEMKDGEPELPETRIRKVSVLEVAITLK